MAKKLKLQDLQEHAASKGGKCLALLYVNSRTKYEWQCAEGHTWWAFPNNVLQSTWCPRCEINRRTHKIEDLRGHAEARGGRCLSETYGNSNERYTWKCATGHQWIAAWKDIKNGGWCPVCKGRKAKDG